MNILNIPYLLGGKALWVSIALVNTSLLKFSWNKDPRNTVDQINYNNESIVDTKHLRKLFSFWDGHVAILKSKSNIIHSNAYHRKLKKKLYPLQKKVRK